MSFRLRKNESAGAGIRRVARELVTEAVALIEDEKGDPAETIHELRKQLKKLRAVLRLVRGELGADVYGRDNSAARDLGRKLSPVRDAAIRVSALDRLREVNKKDFPADDIAPVQKRLAARHRAALRRLRSSGTLSAIARELVDLGRRSRTWPLVKPGYSGLEPGLRRVYRAGRAAREEAFGSGTDEAFHEWRKRAKDLRYHFELLGPVSPGAMQDAERALHDLTDCLGDDHDLSDLRRVLKTSRSLMRGARCVKRVVDLIDRRRSELQAKARAIGVRVYGEKPKAFSMRIGTSWDAWRS